jgi:hypothetical protein
MRQLTNQEVTEVSGGFSGGTPIPFVNGFVSGANWPGGAPGVATGVVMAWNAGLAIGAGVNSFNTNVSNMSLGEAIHRTGES